MASCVDYCTAYMGTWSGLTGLYFRETTGLPSVSAGTSLALTASLMQFTHLGDGNFIEDITLLVKKKSESLQTVGRHLPLPCKQ